MQYSFCVCHDVLQASGGTKMVAKDGGQIVPVENRTGPPGVEERELAALGT